MIKAVIFDLDGTLTEFNLDFKACRTQVIQRLSEQGMPQQLFSLNESAFDMLLKIKKYLGPEPQENEMREFKKIVFSIVENFELQAAKETKMFPGVLETLDTLRKMRLKMGLCTISGKKASGLILRSFGIEHFFGAVFPRESVINVKPNPVHLQAVLDSLNVNANEAIFVGDSIKDIICATKLGVMAVGVTTGLSSMEQLKNSGSNYIISSITEVPHLITELNLKS
ncbi:MAG: HAD family hydrolase [Candidatus Bathyarchaeota archaeon]|nr:HAD family hydrolase [Candidatus Bathyarchaeum tardum]WGM88557.1 MAG: HAD family hydrolase [Candidatus Bathyarchaeum tardum]WNZ29176.1 MAG: HAD family hydrolase [Candidatus Bathyarchaeota archaeon]